MKKLLLAGLVGVALMAGGPVNAQNLLRLSAEYQNQQSLGGSGEVSTTVAPAANGGGGTVVYDKTLTIGGNVDVIYLNFSAQGDTHNGSALLMTATLMEQALLPVVIQPPAGSGIGGGGPSLDTGWWTLMKLPNAASTNCNDGGGGPADCHDNAFGFSGCWRLQTNGSKTIQIKIKLADLPGGDDNRAFYERAFITIDGQHDNDGSLCTGVGMGPH
jgi:hypothetical protein